MESTQGEGSCIFPVAINTANYRQANRSIDKAKKIKRNKDKINLCISNKVKILEKMKNVKR